MMKYLLLILLLFTSSANALPVKEVDALAGKQEELKKIESFLNSMKSFETEFTQISAGEKTTGKFYLKRPGKFRWEYLTGHQVLIIGNNTLIVYYDKSLNEVTHIPTRDSIANLLARKEIKLSGDIKIISLTDDGGLLRLLITQSKNPAEGRLALFFDKQITKLAAMHVIDEDRNLTEIEFTGSKLNPKLADDIFIFKNPKFYKNVWDKK